MHIGLGSESLLPLGVFVIVVIFLVVFAFTLITSVATIS
jgi:hypothetical protein